METFSGHVSHYEALRDVREAVAFQLKPLRQCGGERDGGNPPARLRLFQQDGDVQLPTR